jgi:prepilin-type N-terminal cleavage/methylation domain-containing protein
MKYPKYPAKKKGFSLVEMMAGTFVMSLVITGGLVALGQATLLSEKQQEQSIADFFLRTETEQIRAKDWAEIETLSSTVQQYEEQNSGNRYPNLQTLTATELKNMNMSAEVKSDSLNSAGEVGKIIFHVTLNWSDKTGKPHEETRVIVVTEGGFSAGT